jgi:pimeloyl-ACP methyl ester carboxylesterase
MARRMVALVPGARTAILPGLGHMTLAEAPEAVSAALAPFLEEALGVE